MALTENNACITKHNLDFESCEDYLGLRFRVGTCTGLWGSEKDSYYILAVTNDKPNNGHLDDVFEWFEFSCKRDKKNMLVLQLFNANFYLHLVSKRGFIPLDTDGENVIKVFNKTRYNQLIKKGNSIIDVNTSKCK